MSRSEYLHRLNEIASGDEARRASSLFFKVVVEPGLPHEQCAARTQEFQRTLEHIVDTVEALQPPAEVEQLHEFVSAARASVAAVRQAAAAAEAGTLRCGPAMNRRIYGLPSTARAEAALQGLAKKGYVFGLNSPD